MWMGSGARPIRVADGGRAALRLLSGMGHLGGGVLCLWFAATTRAPADTTLKTTGTVQYQYNSNVYDLQTGVTAPGQDRGDSDISYGGGFQLADHLDLQKLFLNVSGTEFRFDHNTDLDHSEYNLDGGLNWKLGKEWDGTLEISRVHTLVPFFNLVPGALTQSHLSIETDQREAGQIQWQFNPDFRLDASAYTHRVQEPLVNNPDLRLSESSALTAIQVTPPGGLTGGVTISYLSGKFEDSTMLAPSYHQINYASITSLNAAGHSSFYLDLGYTQRVSANGTNAADAITGSLEYKDQITGKTSADVIVSRAINAYVANTGSEIDTTAIFDLHWTATYKIDVQLQYSFTDSDLLGQGVIPGTNRIDHLQHASAMIDYRIRRWLTIRPYANVQTRKSVVPTGDFNASVYGITFVFVSEK